MRKKWNDSWTILVLSKTNQAIIQRRFHKIPIYIIALSILSFLIVTSSLSYFYYQHIQDLKQEKETLNNALLKQETIISDLMQEKSHLIDESSKTAEKMSELLIIEKKIREVLDELNPDQIGASSIQNNPNGGLGGLEQTLVKTAPVNFIHTSQDNITTIDAEMVTYFRNVLENIEYLKLQLAELPVIWPTDSRIITSKFGTRKDPFTRRLSFHEGLDIGGTRQNSIFATANGVVQLASYDGGYGLSVVIEHLDGYTTRYGHLSKIHVNVGDTVTQGQVIGKMGTTGRSTGVHLHYEILKNGNYTDPYTYVEFLNREDEMDVD
ncbi:M23 family metallopeptidase [Bacillus sp. HMF5848]|uniref:M23 family metallopeptidase n=1 Tax=Bacillus sp. HMF5848 TaxID=2495421 RepID=UPI000F79236F|nr:M23 family metallopeptidase [Bacillus sp. HMF5848]RSK25919.1 M23 family metallopeptidase [Bacillus sp. HMF5848]